MNKYFILPLFLSFILIFSGCHKDIPTPAPTVDFSYYGAGSAPSTVSFTAITTNATSYIWDFGDNGSSITQNPQHTYTSGGVFTVKFTAIGSGGSNSITKTINISVSSYSIGLSYGGGIIFYIDNTGKHGLIAATSDQSTSISWYNGTFLTSSNLSTSIGSGNANTSIIIGFQGTGNYAASLCRNLQLNGYSDWYLPSKDELNQLYIQWNTIGGFYNTYYWSSSDWSTTATSAAWAQNFTDGTQNDMINQEITVELEQ